MGVDETLGGASALKMINNVVRDPLVVECRTP